jgi:hypothetical protein
MNEFKIGQKIEVIGKDIQNSIFYSKGAIGIIVDIMDDDLDVDFSSCDTNLYLAEGNHCWFVDINNAKIID